MRISYPRLPRHAASNTTGTTTRFVGGRCPHLPHTKLIEKNIIESQATFYSDKEAVKTNGLNIKNAL